MGKYTRELNPSAPVDGNSILVVSEETTDESFKITVDNFAKGIGVLENLKITPPDPHVMTGYITVQPDLVTAIFQFTADYDASEVASTFFTTSGDKNVTILEKLGSNTVTLDTSLAAGVHLPAVLYYPYMTMIDYDDNLAGQVSPNIIRLDVLDQGEIHISHTHGTWPNTTYVHGELQAEKDLIVADDLTVQGNTNSLTYSSIDCTGNIDAVGTITAPDVNALSLGNASSTGTTSLTGQPQAIHAPLGGYKFIDVKISKSGWTPDPSWDTYGIPIAWCMDTYGEGSYFTLFERQNAVQTFTRGGVGGTEPCMQVANNPSSTNLYLVTVNYTWKGINTFVGAQPIIRVMAEQSGYPSGIPILEDIWVPAANMGATEQRSNCMSMIFPVSYFGTNERVFVVADPGHASWAYHLEIEFSVMLII